MRAQTGKQGQSDHNQGQVLLGETHKGERRYESPKDAVQREEFSQ